MNIEDFKSTILGVLLMPIIIVLGILISPVVKRRKEDLSKQIPRGNRVATGTGDWIYKDSQRDRRWVYYDAPTTCPNDYCCPLRSIHLHLS